MRCIAVIFTLHDESEERLKKIAEEYKKQHDFVMSENELFDAIMCLGSSNDIDAKIKFHE